MLISTVLGRANAIIKELNAKALKTYKHGLNFINKDSLSFTLPEAEMLKKMREIKQAANETGVEIWSIHMPYGKEIDISFVEEERRQKVIAFHQQVLKYVAILKPKIMPLMNRTSQVQLLNWLI